MTADPPFSAHLRASCAADWRRAHEEHPFVRAMGDGTLSLERFQYFMRQDYVFLVDYCRLVAVAAAKSADLGTMGWWARLLDETLNQEMTLHRSFCADFGITEAELEATEPAPATAAYTDHIVRTGHEGSIAEIAAALLPCQWGYDEIGRMLERRLTPEQEGTFHARWIRGYCAPEYRQMTDWLRGLVDRRGASADAGTRGRMLTAFRASTRYEYLFWDAAWRLESWREPIGQE